MNILALVLNIPFPAAEYQYGSVVSLVSERAEVRLKSPVCRLWHYDQHWPLALISTDNYLRFWDDVFVNFRGTSDFEYELSFLELSVSHSRPIMPDCELQLTVTQNRPIRCTRKCTRSTLIAIKGYILIRKIKSLASYSSSAIERGDVNSFERPFPRISFYASHWMTWHVVA